RPVRPAADPASLLVQVQPHRGGLTVVTVGELPVGIVIGDAGQLVAHRVDLADELARAGDGFEPPPGERERALVRDDPHRGRGDEVLVVDPGHDRGVRANLASEARYEHRYGVDEGAVCRAAVEGR